MKDHESGNLRPERVRGPVLRRFGEGLLQWLYPGRCTLCTAPAPSGICGGCRADLAMTAHPCPTCAQPLPADGLCPSCQRDPATLDAVWAPFAYAWPLSGMLLQYKNGGHPQLARPLARLLADHLDPDATWGVDRVIPVPLHDSRLAERGFNQSESLARALCRSRGLVLDCDSARRVIATRSQQGLGRQARRRNLRGAFTVDGDLEGERVLLLDDVMTTGTTLNMLAAAVRRAGAAWVGAAALARA